MLLCQHIRVGIYVSQKENFHRANIVDILMNKMYDSLYIYI